LIGAFWINVLSIYIGFAADFLFLFFCTDFFSAILILLSMSDIIIMYEIEKLVD